jgi:hypothetical protein
MIRALMESTSTTGNRSTSRPDLFDDQRGAVMLTGLCMACFLIGSLWVIVGIGDTIVFRQRMQEAADHGALTSAMIHARGMNFIAACNIVLLVLVAVHVVMGIINDITMATCFFLIGCPAYIAAHEAWITYNTYMKPVARGIHAVEVAAAYAYPYAGMARGFLVGRKYGDSKHDMNVIAVGSSQIPATLTASLGDKLGLPVEAAKFNSICEKVTKDALGWIMKLVHLDSFGKYAGPVMSFLGTAIKERYCNDLGSGGDDDKQKAQSGKQDRANTAIRWLNKFKKAGLSVVSGLDPGFDKFWGEGGPLVVYKAASNGSPWMQVWGLNVGGKLDDVSERKVSVASRQLDQIAPEVEVSAPFYFAQAEFFFDCTDGWGDESCNKEDNAMYSVRWRARLTRAKVPELARMVDGFGISKIFNSAAYKTAVKSLQKKIPVGKAVEKKIQGELRKGIDSYATAVDDSTQPLGIYH